jgi:hypothetical protein
MRIAFFAVRNYLAENPFRRFSLVVVILAAYNALFPIMSFEPNGGLWKSLGITGFLAF